MGDMHPQALTALLSGEMRDTAELGAMTKHAAENYLPQPSRAHMFRSWGSVIGMLPGGGNKAGAPPGPCAIARSPRPPRWLHR